MKLENAISKVLDDIFYSLNRQSLPSAALLTGNAGVALFNYFYLKGIAPGTPADIFDNQVHTIVERSINNEFASFCNGKPGVNWFFSFLYKNEIFDKEDWDFLCSDDEMFSDLALAMTKNGRYDFLHGGIGIGYHLLFTRDKSFVAFYSTLFEILQSLYGESIEKNVLPGYDLQEERLRSELVNFGLAHGITSILKFCLQCYKQGVCISPAKEMAEGIIDYLLTHVNIDKNRGYFPHIRDLNELAMSGRSRLAWCYGDLSIGYILYQAGILFENEKAVDLAVGMLLNTAKKRSIEETMVYDAGLCHGSAGVAHIYNKVWIITKNPIFKEACEFWMQRTVDFAFYEGGSLVFKKYMPIGDHEFEDSYGLLDGMAGIGLALISYLTGDCGWDYCLMLNN